jgi:hypothetical protein
MVGYFVRPVQDEEREPVGRNDRNFVLWVGGALVLVVSGALLLLRVFGVRRL